MLVVRGADVERGEELGELVGGGFAHDRPEVGDRIEQRLDLLGAGFVAGFLTEFLHTLGHGALSGAELLDALLGEGDDGMVGVVVFFEAERLPVERLLELGRFGVETRELALAVVGVGVERSGEFAAEEVESIRSEDAAAEEVESRLEDGVFLDPEDARMAADVGRGRPPQGDEAAAVPVGALLVAAFHAAAADAAANAAA